MKILIAPDKFKGALNARDVAENIAKGLRDALSDAKIEMVPMADGGEGTAEAICGARDCSWVHCKAHNALGREIATTFGVGEIIVDAAKRGAHDIIIGLGGSATNDGGFGMARALGFQFFSNEHEVESPAELVNATRIRIPTQRF